LNLQPLFNYTAGDLQDPARPAVEEFALGLISTVIEACRGNPARAVQITVPFWNEECAFKGEKTATARHWAPKVVDKPGARKPRPGEEDDEPAAEGESEDDNDDN